MPQPPFAPGFTGRSGKPRRVCRSRSRPEIRPASRSLRTPHLRRDFARFRGVEAHAVEIASLLNANGPGFMHDNPLAFYSQTPKFKPQLDLPYIDPATYQR